MINKCDIDVILIRLIRSRSVPCRKDETYT